MIVIQASNIQVNLPRLVSYLYRLGAINKFKKDEFYDVCLNTLFIIIHVKISHVLENNSLFKYTINIPL